MELARRGRRGPLVLNVRPRRLRSSIVETTAEPTRPEGTHAMMGNMGGMMWGMGLFWLLVIAVLVLAVAAFVKYLFFRD